MNVSGTSVTGFNPQRRPGVVETSQRDIGAVHAKEVSIRNDARASLRLRVLAGKPVTQNGFNPQRRPGVVETSPRTQN